MDQFQPPPVLENQTEHIFSDLGIFFETFLKAFI